MTRVSMSSRRARRRRRAAALVTTVTVGVVIVAAVVGVFAFALLRPDPSSVATPVDSSPAPTPAVASSTVGPTPDASATVSSTPEPPTLPAAQACDRETVLSVWAHPDDDIIFANPTISDAIAAGDCVRTVFVTAGDAGKGDGYVEARELGILHAYNDMRGVDGLWDTTEVVLRTGLHARRLTPQGDPRVSVVFLRLPDGNITGAGFAATGYETLGRLLDGEVPTLAPVGGGPDVSREQLLSSVTELATGSTRRFCSPTSREGAPSPRGTTPITRSSAASFATRCPRTRRSGPASGTSSGIRRETCRAISTARSWMPRSTPTASIRSRTKSSGARIARRASGRATSGSGSVGRTRRPRPSCRSTERVSPRRSTPRRRSGRRAPR